MSRAELARPLSEMYLGLGFRSLRPLALRFAPLPHPALPSLSSGFISAFILFGLSSYPFSLYSLASTVLTLPSPIIISNNNNKVFCRLPYSSPIAILLLTLLLDDDNNKTSFYISSSFNLNYYYDNNNTHTISNYII